MKRIYLTRYTRKHHVAEWSIHRSVDRHGPVIQINLGLLGITVRR